MVSPATYMTTMTVKSLERNSTAAGSLVATSYAMLESKSDTVTSHTEVITATQSTSNSSSNIVITDKTVLFSIWSTITIDTTSNSSTVVIADSSVAQNTSIGFSTITHTDNSLPAGNVDDSSSVTLFTTIAVLILLLMGSVIVSCTVFYIYRWKRYANTGHTQMCKLTLSLCIILYLVLESTQI